MKFYFGKRVIGGGFISLVVLTVLGFYSYTTTQRIINSSALIDHRQTVTGTAELIVKLVIDTETGGRGYVITKDEAYLEPFRNSRAPLNHALALLDSLTRGNAEQNARVDTLRKLVGKKLELVEKTIAARNESFEAGSQTIIEGAGKRTADLIRSCVERLQKKERQDFNTLNTIKGNSLVTFQYAFLGLVIGVVINLVVLFYYIGKTLTERDHAEKKLAEQSQAMQAELERKVAERSKALEESNAIYKIMASNIPGTAITILDRDERYILGEGDFLATMGYDKITMPGKKISEVISPENYVYYEGVIKRGFAGETIVVERQVISGFYTLMKVVPMRNPAGEIFALMFALIDVTEIKRAQTTLANVNSMLETKVEQRTHQLAELNKELEAFSYSVSHDLRAPLRAISGYAQMLREDYSELIGSEGDRITGLIISNGIRMGRLIDDLLDFSRLGRKGLTSVKIDMNNLAREVAEELKQTEQTRDIRIHQTTLEPTHGDVSMIRQVWVNLIANAIKYSSKKEFTNIDISSERQNGFIVYSIADNGAGFDMEHKDKLFGVFQRLHKMNEFEGTGVGLALVKTIITRHGGKVWAEAKVNEGARFYFSLPENSL